MNRSIKILLAHFTLKQIIGYTVNHKVGGQIVPLAFTNEKIAITIKTNGKLPDSWVEYTPSPNTIKSGAASSMVESFLELRKPVELIENNNEINTQQAV